MTTKEQPIRLHTVQTQCYYPGCKQIVPVLIEVGSKVPRKFCSWHRDDSQMGIKIGLGRDGYRKISNATLHAHSLADRMALKATVRVIRRDDPDFAEIADQCTPPRQIRS